MVGFPLESDTNVMLLAWTTTPWTLTSNIALCVHPDFYYVKLKGIDIEADISNNSFNVNNFRQSYRKRLHSFRKAS